MVDQWVVYDNKNDGTWILYPTDNAEEMAFEDDIVYKVFYNEEEAIKCFYERLGKWEEEFGVDEGEYLDPGDYERGRGVDQDVQ